MSLVEGHLAGVVVPLGAPSAPLARLSDAIAGAGRRLGVSLHATTTDGAMLFSAIPGEPVASVAPPRALAPTSLSLLWFAGELEDRRSDLHDAELVAGAWSERGPEALRSTYGDYAVVAVEKSGRVVAAVTPGSHPRAMLYVTLRDGLFVWATHPLLLLEQRAECDAEYFRRWLGMVATGDLTPYRGVCRVPGGHSVMLEPGGPRLSTHRWWKPPVGTLDLPSERDYERTLRDTLRAGVERATRGHRRVAISLSAGIDSASVAVCVAEMVRAGRLEGAIGITSTTDEPLSDESPYAAEMAGRIGLPHRRVVVEDPASPEDALACAAGMGFPASHVLVGRWHRAVADAAQDAGATVVLNGAGAELMTAEIDHVWALAAEGRVGEVARNAAGAIAHVGPRALARAALSRWRQRSSPGAPSSAWARRPWLREIPEEPPQPWLPPAPVRAGDRLLTMLPGAYESHDRAYLGPHPVADRAPYFERRVVELAYALPHWLRLRRTTALVTKTLARNAFPEVPRRLSQQGARVNLNHAVARSWKAIFDVSTLRGLVAALPRSFDASLDRDRAVAAVACLSDAMSLMSVHDLLAAAIWAEGMRRAGWALS